MQRIIIDKPYTPVPPHRGRIWPAVLGMFARRTLRKKFGVNRMDISGLDHLRASLRAGHGILLAPNHCRDEDPITITALCHTAGTPAYSMASAHLFLDGGWKAYLLTRAGAFSVYREGIDRAGIATAIELLAEARRPLVVFPEGFISRTNDRLEPLQEGVTFIAHNAAKKRAKLDPPGKVVIHPVAMRYHFLGDCEAAAAAVLEEIEARLTWPPQNSSSTITRIQKAGEALLVLKEMEYLGEPRSGPIHCRLQDLIDAILHPAEEEWTGRRHIDHIYARVRRLRAAILPDMTKGELDETERQHRWKHLADAYLALQLAHYPPDYLGNASNGQRVLETVERLEEDLTDKIRVHGERSVQITIGPPIEVSAERETRGGDDPLLAEIERQLNGMLGLSSDDL